LHLLLPLWPLLLLLLLLLPEVLHHHLLLLLLLGLLPQQPGAGCQRSDADTAVQSLSL
jgi:hypothetical protein